MNLTFNQNLPRKTVQVGKYTIHFFPFECAKEMLEDVKFFNFVSLLTMGTAEERNYGPAEIELDLEELLVKTTLCKSTKEAAKLIKAGSIGIGEPSVGMKKLTGNTLKVSDPYNALITINRSQTDWVLITIEK